AGIPLHLWLQRTPAPAERAEPLDFLAASLVQAEPQPLPPAPEDPVALGEALYAAARGGRVDQALRQLEAGAEPHAPPPEHGPRRTRGPGPAAAGGRGRSACAAAGRRP